MKKNKEAWAELKRQGYVVDAQVLAQDNDYDKSATAYVGLVHSRDKARIFLSKASDKKNFRSGREAQRDAHAVARAISRETGLPLRHHIPAEGQKQVSSWTKSRGVLEFEHAVNKRQAEDAYWESPKGKFQFLVFGIGVCILFMLFCIGSAWVMSWLSSAGV